MSFVMVMLSGYKRGGGVVDFFFWVVIWWFGGVRLGVIWMFVGIVWCGFVWMVYLLFKILGCGVELNGDDGVEVCGCWNLNFEV